MTESRIYRFAFVLTISLFACLHSIQAQHAEASSIDEAPIFGGAAVSVDLAGPVMKAIGARYSQMEVAARINFKEKYYPIFEMGLGDCCKSGAENNNMFDVTAPYFRIGADYNLNKKINGNRFFVGFRYAFSAYNYDFNDPDFRDPVWDESAPLEIKGMNGKSQWVEVVAGVETKLWSFIRLGWNLRFKGRIHQNASPHGEPWYVPGYGRNGGSTFGGTVNIIFDVGRSAKKATRQSTQHTPTILQPKE